MANHIYISYNVAGSSSLSGVSQLIKSFDPLFIFLQEIYLSTEQLHTHVGDNYLGVSNIENNGIRKPGSAVLWKSEVNAVVTNIVPLHMQLIQTQSHSNFINIYAPTGSQGE